MRQIRLSYLGDFMREPCNLTVAAETAQFAVLVTADQSLCYQQNLAARRSGRLGFSTNSWPVLRENIPQIVAVTDRTGQRTYLEVEFPIPHRRTL